MIVAIVALTSCFASAPELTTAQEARAQKLYQLFVAPCCWRECVGTHSSPAAADLRMKINDAVARGESEKEIKDHIVRQFGRRILRVPEGSLGLVVYAMPGGAVLLGLLTVIRWIRSNRPA